MEGLVGTNNIDKCKNCTLAKSKRKLQTCWRIQKLHKSEMKDKRADAFFFFLIECTDPLRLVRH